MTIFNHVFTETSGQKGLTIPIGKKSSLNHFFQRFRTKKICEVHLSHGMSLHEKFLCPVILAGLSSCCTLSLWVLGLLLQIFPYREVFLQASGR